MKSFRFCFSLFAVLLLPAFASAASSTSTLSQAKAPILYNHDGPIFRVNPATGAIRRLTPSTQGVVRSEGSWSPNGTRIVYTRASDRVAGVYQTEKLYTIDRDGGSPFLLTRAPGRYHQPAWGPGPMIALVDASSRCLAIVRRDGTGLRPLFCPPFAYTTEVTWLTPQWSPDGRSIIIQAGQWGDQGLEPPWHVLIYRVDAVTGVARLLYRKDDFGEPITLAVAPDGSHGIYLHRGGSGPSMSIVDFATGNITAARVGPAGTYFSIHYSPDGRRVAFSHDDVEIYPDNTYRGFIGTYVMRAGGSNVRLITSVYTSSIDQKTRNSDMVAGWSGDGSHLLLNHVQSRLEQGRYVDYPTLRTVNVSTHVVKKLDKVKGYAGDDAWFRQR